VNALIREILRTPFAGTGNPEPLRHEFSGYWSRRITREHRIIYRVVGDDSFLIAQLRHHY
jgi:toxin YoeB